MVLVAYIDLAIDLLCRSNCTPIKRSMDLVDQSKKTIPKESNQATLSKTKLTTKLSSNSIDLSRYDTDRAEEIKSCLMRQNELIESLEKCFEENETIV